EPRTQNLRPLTRQRLRRLPTSPTRGEAETELDEGMRPYTGRRVLRPHGEERCAAARLEPWATVSPSAAHPSRRAFGPPQDEGREGTDRRGATLIPLPCQVAFTRLGHVKAEPG